MLVVSRTSSINTAQSPSDISPWTLPRFVAGAVAAAALKVAAVAGAAVAVAVAVVVAAAAAMHINSRDYRPNRRPPSCRFLV